MRIATAVVFLWIGGPKFASGGGPLVPKDVMLMAGSGLVLVDSARAVLAHAPRAASIFVRTTPTAIPARP